MTTKKTEEALQELLKKNVQSITPDDVALLANSLVPSAVKSNRSLAFLCLSKLVQGSGPDQHNDSTVKSVAAYVEDVFSGEAEDAETYIPLVSLLTAQFSLAPGTAVSLLMSKIVQDGSKTADILDVLLESAELRSPLQPALAELLGQAASSKAGRDTVKRAETWLRGALEYDTEGELGVLCAVALSKLSPEQEQSGEAGVEVDKNSVKAGELGLAKKMMDHITASASPAAILPTLEGLSILTTKPHVKHLLITSQLFLSALLKLSPVPEARPSSLPVTPRGSVEIDERLFEPVETSLCYGLTTILANITQRKPILSAEDEQIAKLRAMAISSKKGAAVEEDPFDSDEAVEERVKAVIRAGIIPSLRGLARAESVLVKEALSRLCLNLVHEPAHRPIFIRDGGFRVLSMVVRDLTASATGQAKPNSTPASGGNASPDVDCLSALQALAKLVITTPPHLLFPPPHLTTCVNALNPIYQLLAHPKSSLLQTFEALMALTNLASIDPSIADRIVAAHVTSPVNDTMWRGSGREDDIKVMTRIEELLLDNNTLVRRAATELVCNIVSSKKGHAYFAGSIDDNEVSVRIKSRLNVLLVLTSIDDTPTRLAAGGAVAILTESSSACSALLRIRDETSNRSVWLRIGNLLEPDSPETGEDGEDIPVISSAPLNPDLVHRGVITILNLLEHLTSAGQPDPAIISAEELAKVRQAGIEEKVMGVVKEVKRREILEPAVEVLKILRRYPA